MAAIQSPRALALACSVSAMLAACGAQADAPAGATPAPSAETTGAHGDTAVVDGLPLRRGYYVRVEDACGEASRATLALVRRDGMSGCSFDRIERIGEGRYRATETCQEVQGPQPSTYEVEQEYEVLAEDRYRVNFEGGGSSEFRFCPQDSLPEPWRDNDISDVLD